MTSVATNSIFCDFSITVTPVSHCVTILLDSESYSKAWLVNRCDVSHYQRTPNSFITWSLFAQHPFFPLNQSIIVFATQSTAIWITEFCAFSSVFILNGQNRIKQLKFLSVDFVYVISRFLSYLNRIERAGTGRDLVWYYQFQWICRYTEWNHAFIVDWHIQTRAVSLLLRYNVSNGTS